MPLAIKKLLKNDEIDAVVTMGAVIEGATSHDEIVVQHASRKIADLALEYNKPVGLGITGPGMTRLEAHQRVEYGKRAVEAAVKMYKILRIKLLFFLNSIFIFNSHQFKSIITVPAMYMMHKILKIRFKLIIKLSLCNWLISIFPTTRVSITRTILIPKLPPKPRIVVMDAEATP